MGLLKACEHLNKAPSSPRARATRDVSSYSVLDPYKVIMRGALVSTYVKYTSP